MSDEEKKQAAPATPPLSAGDKDAGKKQKMVYLAVAALLIIGVYLYLSYKSYVPKIY